MTNYSKVLPNPFENLKSQALTAKIKAGMKEIKASTKRMNDKLKSGNTLMTNTEFKEVVDTVIKNVNKKLKSKKSTKRKA